MRDVLLIGLPFLIAIGLAGVFFAYEPIAVWFFRIRRTGRSPDEMADVLGGAVARFPRTQRTVLEIEGQTCEYESGPGPAHKEHCGAAIVVRYWFMRRYRRSLGHGRTATAVASIQCFGLGFTGLFYSSNTAADLFPVVSRAIVIGLALLLIVFVMLRERNEFDQDCRGIVSRFHA